MNKQRREKEKEDPVTESYIVERSRCEMKATAGQRTTKQEQKREEGKKQEQTSNACTISNNPL